MSLQGTFDTLSVVELFGLLSTASKTGALRLEAGDHEAAVYVTAGLCCAVESDDVTGPASTDEELARRLVDAGFTVARQPAGSFRFDDSEPPPFAADLTTRFEPAVTEITEMLGQWREIEATIPSLDVRVRLAPVLRGEEIVLTAQEWSLLVALEGMPSVREVVARRREPVIQVCRLVKDLAERGAIDIGTDMARPEHRVVSPAGTEVEPAVVPDPPTEISPVPARRVHEAASVGHLAPSEPYAPSAADAAVAAVVAAAAEAATGDSGGDGSQDRGALLRLFSALKE